MTLNNSHIDSLHIFIEDINRALSEALSTGGNTYTRVSVLFLRWADDVFITPSLNNSVQGEIDDRERNFVHDHSFETEIYLILSEDSQRSLQRKIFLFQEAHNSKDELLMVYYGGHGILSKLSQSIGLSKTSMSQWVSCINFQVGAMARPLIGSQSSIS